MAYYTCNDCENYDPNNTNRWNDGFCSYYCKYFSKSDKACSKFEKRRDIDTTCFLTTAICNIFGFEDNCFGLETLRNFRDNYLVKDERYHKLLAEYEVIGPVISNNLYHDEHRMEVADYYFENYLYNIIVNLSTYKDYDEAVNMYIEMVNDMKRMYGVNLEVTDSDVMDLSVKINNNQYKVKRLVKVKEEQ